MNAESKKSKFGAFSVLVSGSCISGLLNLAFYPVFSRLYSQEDFGILAVLASVSAFLCIISTGKYEQAIIIAKNDKEAIGLSGVSLGICLPLCVIVLILFLTDAAELAAWCFHSHKVRNLLWLCPFTVLGVSIYNCYNEWCVRKQHYVSLAVNRGFNSIVITLSKTALFFLPDGLSFGDTIGRFFSGAQTAAHFWITEKQIFRKNIPTLADMKTLARRYAHFPKFIVPDQLINYFAGNLPVFAVSSLFGIEVLGSYSMAGNVLAIPAAFTEKAFMDMFRGQACEEFKKTGRCRRIYKKFVFLFVPPFLLGGAIAMAWMPELFRIALGERWEDAGVIAQILAPAIFLRFFFMVFSPVWIITEKLKYRLYWQIFFVSVSVIALVLGGVILRDQQIMFYLLSTAWSIAYLAGIISTWKLGKGTGKTP